MPESRKFCWGSVAVGAAAAAEAAFAVSARPREPKFHLMSIDLAAVAPDIPAAALDAEMILTVHVSNPNIVGVRYSGGDLSISYGGSPLGSALVPAGSQPARSCQLLRLRARLSGSRLARRAREFLGDVGRREMVLDSAVELRGAARVLWWDHRFRVHVDSHVTVDPLFLDVLRQENKSKLNVFVKP